MSPRPVSLARLGVAMARGRRMPFSITFILTDRCNFRCTYCNIPEVPDAEMSTAEICAAIDAFADAGMMRASFSGGEALLRKDAVDIIAHAKRRGLFTSLNTNGFLTGAVFDRLAGVLDMLVVSLDGTQEVHDAVCKVPGSHARVLDLLARARERKVATATICVLGPWNLHLVDEVLRTAQTYGAWAYFQPAHDDCYDQSAGMEPGIGSAELNRIADDLTRGAREGLPVASSPGYMARLRRGPAFSDCTQCAAGRFFATMLPDGRVVPCHLTAALPGILNGREVGFPEAFYGMPRPTSGKGCAISPYQESDLIFSLDPRAIVSAFRKSRPPRQAMDSSYRLW